MKTELQIGGGVGLQYISDARRQALKASLRNGHNHTHVLEIDRLLQWIHNYPIARAVLEARPDEGRIEEGTAFLFEGLEPVHEMAPHIRDMHLYWSKRPLTRF